MISLIQYGLAAAAMTAIVLGEVLGWGLTTATIAMLAAVAGWLTKTPADMLRPKE